jgi:adenylosuccinate lyase
VGTRLTDAGPFAHLWGTDEVRAVLDDDGRLRAWLTILSALADAQAEIGIVPREAADAIAAITPDRLDHELIAAETRRTSHSTLGLIKAMQRALPDEAAEYVYYGITVQDLTDTWVALVIRDVGGVVWRDLRAIEESLLVLAVAHRSTVMPGRTHGQPGAPITFGMKVASWVDEIRRHLERLAEGRSRWLVGQLGGAVGTLGFFGQEGPRLRRLFCERLGLADPGIAWLTSRDRIAEFGLVLAMISSTLARIGGEVYELQRSEIGELREPSDPDTVGSITMPHKRNPERSEHLDTLSRLVRANAGVLLEAMVQAHERDGRGWKTEWVALPEVCLLTSTALRLGVEIVAGLEVDVDAMRRNVDAGDGYLASERVLAQLSGELGKHTAQALLQETLAAGRDGRRSLIDALAASGAMDADSAAALVADPAIVTAESAVDVTVERCRAARAKEPDRWT